MQSGSGVVVLAIVEAREVLEYGTLAEVGMEGCEPVWPVMVPGLVPVMISGPDAELKVVESVPGGSEKE